MPIVFRIVVSALAIPAVLLIASMAIAQGDATPGIGDDDPYVWLEKLDSPEAMRWVRAENDKTASGLEKDPRFATFRAQALAIEQSQDRIPFAQRLAGRLWNFWQDAGHPHGV